MWLFSACGGKSHACRFLEHSEIVLKGDGRERMILALDLDAFLDFDRLMAAVPPSPAGMTRPVNSSTIPTYVIVLDEAIFIALKDDARFQGLLHVMVHLEVHRIVEIARFRSFWQRESPIKCGSTRLEAHIKAGLLSAKTCSKSGPPFTF